MSTVFITQHIWPQLTKAVRGSRQSCAVAVAYFGKGAGTLLPLTEGSSLVVDASERAVASGQTCPTDLAKLVKRGVKVYSVPNLHAKVFVLGGAAYIGSTNVSNRSASQLVEAVIRTTEPGAVRAARKFVRNHCLHELTPEVLKRLGKLYRPPRVPGGKRGKKAAKQTFSQPTLPRVLLAQCQLEEWSARDQKSHDAGAVVAKNLLVRPSNFDLDKFRWPGKCPFRRGDVVMKVTDEGGGSVFATPPGNVLYVHTRHYGSQQVSYVFLECPIRRRRRIKTLARALGRGAKKALERDGLVRDAGFAQALLKTWAE